MRLHLAIELSPECGTELERTVAALRTLEPDLAWEEPGQRQLTLKCLGDVDAATVPALIVAVERVSRVHRPFALHAAGIGAFPIFRRARMIWAGVESEPRLELLHHDLELACRELGYEVEGRPFRPQVTLARVRVPIPIERVRRLARAARALAFSASQEVAAVTLLERVATSAGARDRRLHAITLGEL